MAPARPLTGCSTASGSSSATNSIGHVAGRLLICAADAHDARVCEVSGTPVDDGAGAPALVCGHRTPIQCLATSGALFATGSADGVVKLWQPLDD
eukprot:1218181-Prymnesium_polylepis.1